VSYEEEDTCVSYEEEDTCVHGTRVRYVCKVGGGYMCVI
jgi:hypothetical protein